MAEIDYVKEKCWKIKEQRPIPVSVVPYGNYYRLNVAPMSMKYSTYEDLDMNHDHFDLHVGMAIYDFYTGECYFTGDSIKDVELWFEKYKDIIIRT